MTRHRRFDFNLLRAMEVFVAVAETRHLTRAAELLGVTQSAVSQQLAHLEAAFGAALLDRDVRPPELTRAGATLYRRAQRVLNEVDDLVNELRRLDAAPIPFLRVGVLASVATTLIGALSELARVRFGVPEAAFYAGLASDHPTLLRTRRADIVVTSDAMYDLDGLQRHHILSEPFLLVLPRDWRRPADDLAALATRLPLVRFTTEAPVGRLTDQHLRRVGLELPRTLEADRSSMVMSLVATGQGFAIMSPSLLIDGLNEGMRVRVQPLPIPQLRRRLSLVARAGELGPLPEAFAACCAKVLTQAFAARFDPALLEGVAGP